MVWYESVEILSNRQSFITAILDRQIYGLSFQKTDSTYLRKLFINDTRKMMNSYKHLCVYVCDVIRAERYPGGNVVQQNVDC